MGIYRNTVTVSTDTILTSLNENIKVDVTAGAIELMLPIGTGDSRVNDVIKITHNTGDITSNNITIVPHTGGTATILGGPITIDSTNGISFLELTDNNTWVSLGGSSNTGGSTGSTSPFEYSLITAIQPVLGSNNSDSDYAFVGNGSGNTITNGSKFSFIGTGKDNTISSSFYSSIIGGIGNMVDSGSSNAFIGGGMGNNFTNGSLNSFIGGGSGNTITNASLNAFIGAGKDNSIITSSHSSIIGGSGNTINSDSLNAFIGAGKNNTINILSPYSSIIGGSGNTINHNNSHIIGSNITSLSADTTHVEKLNIKQLNGTTPIIPLALDVNGMVVSASTTSGPTKFSLTTGFTGSVIQTITHNLNTDEIIAQVWNSSNNQVTPTISINGLNSIDIIVGNTGNYKVVIIG